MRTAVSLLAFLLLPLATPCAVIGHSEPAKPLTEARIATLPKSERAAWLEYLAESRRTMQADRAALQAERQGMAALPPDPELGPSARSMPLDRDPAWYGSTEARHIADVIVSYQIPSGGWGKNMNMAGSPRQRGQSYVTNNLSRFPSLDDFDEPADPSWHYVGTIDNDATTTEILFLARVQFGLLGATGDAYRSSILRGLRYLLRAQYPNGGWPQVWPLEGGYHDAITLNDDAMTNVLEVFGKVAAKEPDFAFVPQAMRAAIGPSIVRGNKCILATQIIVEGKRTVWAQQYDMLTLAPVAARNYEPAALSSEESAHMLEYLMAGPRPSPQTIQAIHSGASWLQQHAIHGKVFDGGRNTPGGRHLADKPDAGPLWARFYSITTGQPVFGDRDKSIHDDVNELSLERRNGYAWYMSEPAQALQQYAAWWGGISNNCLKEARRGLRSQVAHRVASSFACSTAPV